MKIVTLITNADFDEEDVARLKEKGKFVKESVRKLKTHEIVERAKDADILIIGSSGVEFLGREAMEQCPKLKYITIMGVAADPMDVKAATELGIKVSNYVGVNSQSVAEHTWGMILSLSKKVTESHIAVKEGETSFLPFLGKEMQGKTIGIVGFGEIGSRVAKIAQGFDMKVLSHTRSKKSANGVEFVELEKLLKNSDAIVLTLPHTDETDKMIGERELKMMKDGVILINPAREGLVDQEAILQALEDGKLYGFGMELNINSAPDQRYYNYSNVLLTPHNGFFTEESEKRASRTTLENVLKFIEGNPQNLVN